ncbi:hypothetical protein [Streptomyces luteireticuli]|uniref:hypothetical protein n=1 Tax=Streptomyces luteireticuli TaxID=173858 RepID=UPI003557E9C6
MDERLATPGSERDRRGILTPTGTAAEAGTGCGRSSAISRTRRQLAAAAATAAAISVLCACGSSGHGTAAEESPADDGRQAVAAVAKRYMEAWMVKPARPKEMCELETTSARPNYSKDGGSAEGCVSTYEGYFKDQDTDSGRPPLTVSVDNVQDVVASRTHPAGKGVLATLRRDGEEPSRYALRLVQEGGSWRVEQNSDVGSRYRNTADPVADVLLHAK